MFKASRGIEDIYELTYFRKDASRFPAVVSVTALRDAKDVVIGYLLIGTDTPRESWSRPNKTSSTSACVTSILHALPDRIQHRRADDPDPSGIIPTSTSVEALPAARATS